MTGMTPEQKLLDLIKSAQTKLKLKKDLKIFTKVSIILIPVIIVVLAVFLKDFLTFDYSVSKKTEVIDQVTKEEILPSVTDYEESPGKVDIVPEEEDSFDKKDFVKELNLLGIVEGNRVQAVVEDKETNKTFFLYEGDSLGELKVYNIKKSKVILDYKGDKIELNM